MAPLWATSIKDRFKRSKNHDGQAGKPSGIIAGSSDVIRERPKLDQHAHAANAHSGADDRVASGQLPPATVLPVSSPQATPPAPVVSVSQPASSGSTTVVPSSVRGPLWNRAYDELKAKEPDLVDAYERILSRKLSNGELDPTDSEPPENEIEQKNPEKRRSQMTRLTQAGLDKTEKEAAAKQGIEDGMQAVHAVRGIIDGAVKAAPEAALAWVGVCFVLEILANPITEAVANRSGLAYVISRMDWYWNLSDLLLDKHRMEKAAAGLRDELEKHVLDLYKMLLAYQMRSICSYYRNRGVVFLRDMIKLDDWDGRLKSIKEAEETVRTDSAQYNTVQIKSHLQSLVNAAGSEEQKLQDIIEAIERQTTQQKKMQEEDGYKECIQAVFHTDPHLDKKRIEETKGGLLADSYRWVLENTTFQHWQQSPHDRLLWVKGDPGKGKTMLLCGIIDELRGSLPETALLSYFFCQATDSRINNATAVLRGLLYMLVSQQLSLVSHVRKRHDHAGEALFEGPNAWVALTEIFVDVLRDPNLGTTYLIIDALDECATDRTKLLEFIAQQSSTSDRVKWIISSRNWPEIGAQLERAGHNVRLSLELNATSVAAAVDVFIRQKVDQLAQAKKYDDELRHDVLQQLTLKADNTFLWVALVCQDLKATATRHVLKKLASFPPGLDALYKQMMLKMNDSDDAETCRCVLATAAVLYRPVTISELVALVGQLEDVSDDVREIISLCGSFLTLCNDTVYFVHQSAKDFLLATGFEEIFPGGTEDAHRVIFSKSLAILSRTLHRDMYGLKEPGIPIENTKPADPDPLAASRYSCVYWIDHLCESNPMSSAVFTDTLQDGGTVDTFLREKYLYWLEALSLCGSMPKGVLSVAKLQSLVPGIRDLSSLEGLVNDAYRFIMYHKGVIESYPLQAYASALLFSPTGSLIRRLFQHEEPKGISIKPGMSDSWSACLQTLEGHSNYVMSVAFSHDSAQLASASGDNTVKIWDASSGACLHTLEGHSDLVMSVAFSHDSAQLASASSDKTVKIWDASSGACLHTLEGHSDSVMSVAFSHDSAQLASASLDNMVKIWDASSGACLHTLEGHSSWVRSVAFSHDSARLASASYDNTVKVWDASSGACLHTLEDHSSYVISVAFSHDSTRLASASSDNTVKIWDASNSACLHTLEGHSSYVSSVAFSHDSAQLASASSDNTVKIWDASSGACLHTLEGHSSYVRSVAFSHDSAQLASASSDNTVKIWDASNSACLHTLEGHSNYVMSVAFSHDSAQLASASGDKTVKIWDASSGVCLHTLEGHSSWVRSVAFSHDSAQLASASYDNTVKIWDASSGACLQTFNIGQALLDLSFDSTGSYLHTEIGTIVVQKSQVGISDVAEPKRPLYLGIGVSSDNMWIQHASKSMLWVPSEYRPSCSAVCGTNVGIGVGSGRVWMCSIDL